MPPWETPEDRALALFGRRSRAGLALRRESGAVGRACHAMAGRFRRGGSLYTFGGGVAAADAAHIAVEFVHPVIVGKRALPAVSLGCGTVPPDGSAEVFATRLEAMAGPHDIALALSADGRCEAVLRGLEKARERGALTVALTGGDGGDLARSPAVDHLIVAASDDPRVVREMHVTVYHVLWELVHVFLERPGGLDTEVPS
ncbi:SIS domain-containing protein [Actinocorallia sp. B10E7]|uniref:D-sedoheptulose-7-phosphate isomerase n=1 Tax=Actinocorallia sp. B10E7 TaxID=3153558 RepID=UPI00325E3EDA